ncbi:MAG: reverse transcriptase family protein, partial [Candidatus Thiodiazotropha endolucinida]|nr:reverse transcriptase family protein [Candidatus Thiodiazotropha taylori]MCW4343184.1 reverse transcriptase family protein [Candidatus Thiodiazotropha endolucinida]
LFHKLNNRQRGKLSNCINELHVNDRVYKTDADILNGWRQHFEQLASPCFDDRFDKDYEKLVALELNEIIDLCDRDPLEYEWITQKEVSSAIKSLNKGKSPDLYNVTAEHLIKGEQQLVPVLTILLNKMLQLGTVPDSLKLGILTPVFKKKGSNLDSKNYRGITVNPTVTKVLETVLRERINPLILRQQNSLQRGFTEGSAPMNCSLILEESIRNNRDQKLSTHVAFLDAKSAFDVVNHSSLMRKLYHTGVDGVHWNLIHNLHSNARAAVKWNNAVSDGFPVKQGVRQGGILSTDLFKVYNNEMLNRMVDSGLGTRIGAINCVAPTCADDVALSSDRADDLQSLINIGVDYSELEKFQLQPTKSVVLSHLTLGDKNRKGMEETWTMYGEPMPVVTEASHMGILRSHCTEESAVRDNIKKARRTLYSLMSSGLHGQNGLDPETSIQLLNIYVLPILVYGLEVILPKPKYLNMLERFFKKMLKQVMSLPTTVADCAVYAVSGTIPIEATIHKRALSLYGNICRLPESSIEKQLAERQLCLKTNSSHSWFIAIKQLHFQYSLPDPTELLVDQPTKQSWKRKVNKEVDSFRVSKIKDQASLYPSLRYLNVGEYGYGRRHMLIQSPDDVRDIPRIQEKLRMATGTYILQVNRVAFNQSEVSPLCLLCGKDDENLQHFILECDSLAGVREPIMNNIDEACASANLIDVVNNPCLKLQLILDHTAITQNNGSPTIGAHQHLKTVESYCRRLCYALHCERYKRLQLIPRRKERRNKRKRTH